MTLNISAVLFDLDGTLRHNHPNGYDIFIGFLQELGFNLSPEQIRAGHRWTHYYWSIAPEMHEDMREFGGEGRDFWARYTERQLASLGIDGDRPTLAAHISTLFDERYSPVHQVPDDVIPTLLRLKELGYTVGLVSNRLDPLETLVTELGLADFFVFTLSAGQAGSWKPEAAIFHKAVELAGCQPESTVYVGDNYYADVQGAAAAGLHPILIDPHGLFPEAECPVIRTLGELETALSRLGTKPPAPASLA
jgi:HAD superfamily hydrolase (TIGR01509 family)